MKQSWGDRKDRGERFSATKTANERHHPHYNDLDERWKQGETNARRLFEEVQQRGYRGCEATVRSFVARLRKDLPGMVRPPHKTVEGHTPATSPRDIHWLLARCETDLEPEERADLARLLAHSPEAKLLHQLIQAFLRMLRERQFKLLDTWMREARDSQIQELISFVTGIERDYDAVRAGLRLPWS